MLPDFTSDMPVVPPRAFLAASFAGRQEPGKTDTSLAPTHLQIEDAFRHDPAHHQIPKRQRIAEQPAAPIRIGLRPRRPRRVHRHVLRDVADSAAKGISAPFRKQVERVGNLRIAEPDAGTTPGFNSEMHPAGAVELYNISERRELARQVHVLLPAIQRQTFVEQQPVQSHRRCADSHVAPVSCECRCGVGGAPALLRQNGQCIGDRQAWSVDAVGEYLAGGHNASGIGRHVLIDRRQIVRMRQEIVIEKHHNVGSWRGSEYRIPLPRQAGTCAQHFGRAIHLANTLNVCRPRAAHNNAVRSTRLALQLPQRLTQNASATNGGQSNNNIECHKSLQLPRLRTTLPLRTVNVLSQAGTIDHSVEMVRLLGRLTSMASAELVSGVARLARRLTIVATVIVAFLSAMPIVRADTVLNGCTAKGFGTSVPLETTCQDANLACQTAIRSAELRYRLPAGLLTAIGRVESGRYSPITHDVQPWPWTIQAEGNSRYFDSKLEAILWVQQAMQHGIRSIDIGCMQVNLMYHPHAFISLDQGFDPDSNVDYAARFLLQLYADTRNWQQAIGFYHSQTPTLAADYRQRIARATTVPVLIPAKLSIVAQLGQAWRATLPVDQAGPHAATP